MYYTSVTVLTETDETQVGIHHTNLLMCRLGIKSTILGVIAKCTMGLFILDRDCSPIGTI